MSRESPSKRHLLAGDVGYESFARSWTTLERKNFVTENESKSHSLSASAPSFQPVKDLSSPPPAKKFEALALTQLAQEDPLRESTSDSKSRSSELANDGSDEEDDLLGSETDAKEESLDNKMQVMSLLDLASSPVMTPKDLARASLTPKEIPDKIATEKEIARLRKEVAFLQGLVAFYSKAYDNSTEKSSPFSADLPAPSSIDLQVPSSIDLLPFGLSDSVKMTIYNAQGEFDITECFHSIVCLSKFRKVSFEEIRVADYAEVERRNAHQQGLKRYATLPFN